MVCLFRTAWSDPGILPRASSKEAAYVEACMQGKWLVATYRRAQNDVVIPEYG